MSEVKEPKDTEIQDVCEEISGTLEAAFDLLITRREAALKAAIEPLDAEREALAEEHAAIETARVNLERLLPAKARVAQSEADRLTLEGKHAEAATKLEEMREAENAPVAMTTRQSVIATRFESIAGERQAIARRIFETWYGECQTVVSAGETGLFITLLDGLKASFSEYQERTGTGGTLDLPFSFLVKDSHIQNLTAPDRSMEWVSGSRWYGGRVR